MYKLPKTILEEMLSINDELKRGYDLKELFLDLVANSDYKNFNFKGSTAIEKQVLKYYN